MDRAFLHAALQSLENLMDEYSDTMHVFEERIAKYSGSEAKIAAFLTYPKQLTEEDNAGGRNKDNRIRIEIGLVVPPGFDEKAEKRKIAGALKKCFSVEVDLKGFSEHELSETFSGLSYELEAKPTLGSNLFRLRIHDEKKDKEVIYKSTHFIMVEPKSE